MGQTSLIRLASLLAFTGVALGAFGAHGLKALLLEKGTTQTWETAVLYHLIHALAVLIVSGWQPTPKGPAVCFAAGIFIFSGSLYVLSVTGLKILGAITPLGGVAFLAGWLWLGLSAKMLTRAPWVVSLGLDLASYRSQALGLIGRVS